MKHKYFDEWEFKQIIPLIETNPYEAKIRFEDYLKKYPKDYTAYPFYISTLITIRELTTAKNILEYITNIIKKDHFFLNNNQTKNELFKQHILLVKLKLLIYTNKYQELSILCEQNKFLIKKLNFNTIIFYSRKKKGYLNNEIRDTNSYLFRQIVKYEESDFLDHIKKHLDTCDNINKSISIFSKDFPIDKIIQEVKKYIPSEKCLYINFIDDTYIFKYDYCGKDNNKITNYFKVICIHDTTDIITICPSNNCEYLPYIDLNYLTEEKTTTNIKKLSQTEKFNRRFNLK